MTILIVTFTPLDILLRKVFFPLYGAGVLSCLGLMGVFWKGELRRHATIYSVSLTGLRGEGGGVEEKVEARRASVPLS